MAGSVSSLEGFSPSSHGGETNYYGAAGRGAGGWLGRRDVCYDDKEEEWQIPWLLIPITGPCKDRVIMVESLLIKGQMYERK